MISHPQRRPRYRNGSSAGEDFVMAENLSGLLPAPAEDAQAFAERMVVAGQSGTAEAVAFARAGRRGMALYVAGQAALRIGNLAAGGSVPVTADCLDAALAAMIATLTD